MPVNLGDPEWIALVYDADTPAELLPYVGRFVGVPAGVTLPPDGVIDSITVGGITVWGYLRHSPNGYREWVLAAPVNPNVTAINAIPGPSGWTDLAARQVYYNLGSALLGVGVPGADLRVGLKQFYDASVADYKAAVAAGHTPVPPGP